MRINVYKRQGKRDIHFRLQNSLVVNNLSRGE